MSKHDIDVVTIGRASVDLYGQQIGGRLEDMASFSKAVGGCPANIAIGTARLGLRSALITRVGDEAFGRFIREQMAREGVVTDGIHTDPARLTALAILGVRDADTFPLIFYRSDCADAALDESDIDAGLLARTRSVLVTGTHFSKPASAAAQLAAMRLVRGQGGRVILDIDYRPNLWGLAGHDAGEQRFIASDFVTRELSPVLGSCDLIVGTEEEIHIAGGSSDTLAALRSIRLRAPGATIVCKRGALGCVVYEGAIPDRIEDGVQGRGFPIEVYNTLGAGDAFLSGFLRGWLRDEPLTQACARANACGAIAVSRLLCSPEIPSEVELDHFLVHGSNLRALRHDAALNHLHWVTTRPAAPERIIALACDHRIQLEAIADEVGADRRRIAAFKVLAVRAARLVAEAHGGAAEGGFGMFLDGRYGRDALFAASHAGLWTARPVERTGSRPLEFEGGPDGATPGSLAAAMIEWPTTQVAKCLCFAHPDDPEELMTRQIRELQRVQDACRRQGRDLLIEIIAGKNGALASDTVARVVERFYAAGLKPDWWKLEPQRDPAAWAQIERVIAAHDPFCRGIVVLGLDAPLDELVASFAACAGQARVKGFAIGRSIFAAPARDWLAGRIDDDLAITRMAETFAGLVRAWDCRGGATHDCAAERAA